MQVTRRQLLQAGAAATLSLAPTLGVLRSEETSRPDLAVAKFSFDVSPPKGHSLCGGWIKPVEDYDDALEAIGLVIVGAGKPIVLCAVDWTGISNDAHIAWREALAEAAGTTSDRVAVHCVHQHNAPFVCLNTEQIISQYESLPHVIDRDFFQRCLDRAREAISKAPLQSVTHVATGAATVQQVASNRRILGADGKVEFWRASSCTDEKIRALPEGLIDSTLRTVSFMDGGKKLASCHYYATHPMSYYGDGRVSSDFVGLARKRLQAEDPDCLQVYFTGCAGNVAPGKYNDGTAQARKQLTDRMYAAMRESQSKLERVTVDAARWNTMPIQPVPRSEFSADVLRQQIADETRSIVDRNRPAFIVAWIERSQRQAPILLSTLHLGPVSLLHLPSECFIEYQLFAQQQALDRFVATAAYGDGGPWYIPTAEAYPRGIL